MNRIRLVFASMALFLGTSTSSFPPPPDPIELDMLLRLVDSVRDSKNPLETLQHAEQELAEYYDYAEENLTKLKLSFSSGGLDESKSKEMQKLEKMKELCDRNSPCSLKIEKLRQSCLLSFSGNPPHGIHRPKPQQPH